MKNRVWGDYRKPMLPPVTDVPAPGQVQSSCAWCHTMNPLNATWCSQCHHRAHWPPAHCDCASCEIVRKLASAQPYKSADPYRL
jgi:hypothetical protein